MKNTTSFPIITGFTNALLNFNTVPEAKTQSDLRTFEAKILDRLMNCKSMPYKCADSVIKEQQGTVNWCFIFDKSAEVCVALVWQRIKAGLSDIDFNFQPSK